MPVAEDKFYPRITRQALSGFREDTEAAARFQRRSWPMAICCAVSVLALFGSLGAPIFLLDEDNESIPPLFLVAAALSLAAAVLFFILTWRQMHSAVAVSSRTGRPMDVYQLENTLNDDDFVLIYVCHPSRTYFRVVFKTSEEPRRFRRNF